MMKKSPRKMIALLLVTLLSGSFLVTTSIFPASATPTFNAGGNQLSFNSARQYCATFPDTLIQQIGGNDTNLDIGEDFVTGCYANYFGVITIGGQAIDARVTLTETVCQSNNRIDKLDDADADAEIEKRINTDLDFLNTNNTGDEYVEFTVEFFTALATTPVAATLTNVNLTK
jgi:hypothetical protein